MSRFLLTLIFLFNCLLAQPLPAQQVDTLNPHRKGPSHDLTPSLKVSSKYLRDGELAIQCFWGDKKLQVLVLEKDSEQWLQIDRERIEPMIESLIQHQQDVHSNQDKYHRLSEHFLRDSLALAPFLDRAKHLTVIPDGPLSRLSWAALSYEAETFLIERMTVRTAFSPDVLFDTGNKRPPGSLVYAVAPWYGPFPNWDDVPQTRATAASLHTLLGGRLDTGNSARYENFVSMAPLANILYIGAHGTLDPKEPSLSGIQLSDSILTIDHIRTMKLSARFAMLAYCHPKGGDEYWQQGMTDMVEAFAHAGCRSVVMSLWEVSADATALISKLFYKYLKEGNSQELALQKAQQDYLKQAQQERKHPYYWAGISLTGEAGTERTSSVWVIGLGALLIAGMLLLAWLGRGEETHL